MYHYCSEECRRPPIYIKCANCGKEFRVCPYQKDQKRFCSFSCYRKYSGETPIEKKVRNSLMKLHINFTQEFQIERYSIDFFLPDLNICLEADGIYWHDPAKDAKRDKKLRKLGYKIIRLKESDILNTDNIENFILASLETVALS